MNTVGIQIQMVPGPFMGELKRFIKIILNRLCVSLSRQILEDASLSLSLPVKYIRLEKKF